MARIPKWLVALGGLMLLAAPARGQVVAFFPVPAAIPDGQLLTVTPVATADRRYVRLSINPVFIGVEQFTTFPVPGAVSGFGGVGAGGLGGLLGGLGGGGGGGGRGFASVGLGNSFMAGMNGVGSMAPPWSDYAPFSPYGFEALQGPAVPRASFTYSRHRKATAAHQRASRHAARKTRGVKPAPAPPRQSEPSPGTNPALSSGGLTVKSVPPR